MNNNQNDHGAPTVRLNQNERNEPTACFPIPSTSTGITGNGNKICLMYSLCKYTLSLSIFLTGTNFRIVQAPDSDDEPTPDSSPQSVQVSATKVNGAHSKSTAYSSGVDDDQPSERNSRRKRNHSLTTTNYHFTRYSSHSSSRLSNSSSDDDDTSSDDDSSLPFFSNHLGNKKKRLKRNENNETSQTPLLRFERTPTRSRDPKDCELGTPDSGIGSTPGSSMSR